MDMTGQDDVVSFGRKCDLRVAAPDRPEGIHEWFGSVGFATRHQGFELLKGVERLWIQSQSVGNREEPELRLAGHAGIGSRQFA